ncbi:cytochrome P450 [Jackrogersella minutella]|nr:cytochrome P450 [Jackrogersella minutella]
MANLYSLASGTWFGLQDGLVQWVTYAVPMILFVCWAYFALRRVFFSPLSHIPGPKLAALTYLYEGYYEVWLGGKYFLRIAEMHRQYGPIIRITPNEVHFADPEFLDALYPAGGRKTDKPSWFPLLTGTPYSIVSTAHHDVHRQRRNALSSFFSTASIHRFEHIMKQHLNKLMLRLDASARRKSVVRIHEVFKAAASDIITMYAFDNSFNFLDMEDYGQSYFEATHKFFLLTHVCVLIPWLYPLIQNSPDWLHRLLFPGLSEVRDRQNWWLEQVQEIRKSSDVQRVRQTIFGGILSSKLPDEEKSNARLASEAQLVVFAGEGTTAWGLNAALYELLARPDELLKLKAELSTIELGEDGMPSLSRVEGLPYLGAIIQEALRVHSGVLTRQMRVSPEVPVTYVDKASGKTYIIPPGTVTSMSPHITHRDPEAFEDPAEFRPQRWIDNPKLARYFHGFARGSRNCVGMTLARREMALVLATLLMKYDLYDGQEGPTMELYDTERARDVDAHSDYIIPVPAEHSEGVRIIFRA